MDQTYLLVLGLAVLVALGAGARIRNRMLADRAALSPARIAVRRVDRGHKICPKCGMGNLWTERTCISCGGPLKG